MNLYKKDRKFCFLKRSFWSVKTKFFYSNQSIQNSQKNSKILPYFKYTVSKPSLITIGGFDGVHLGHQKIFNSIQKYKKKYPHTNILAITFNPLPKQFFQPSLQPILPLQKRIEKLHFFGADLVLILPFDENLKNILAYSFLKDFLLENLKMHTIFLGKNNAFGKKNKGNINYLRNFGKELSFKVVKIEPVFFENQIISSTKIRDLILKGDKNMVSKLL